LTWINANNGQAAHGKLRDGSVTRWPKPYSTPISFGAVPPVRRGYGHLGGSFLSGPIRGGCAVVATLHHRAHSEGAQRPHDRYVAFQMAEVVVSRRMFADILSLIARLRATPALA
jgi:hypothetical protein